MTTIAHLGRALREGRTTSVELTRRSLASAETVGARLAAFVELSRDGALTAAGRADEELSRGIDRGPLHGLPVAIKDVLATEGTSTTACSRAPKPEGFDGSADALSVGRLRQAGAVVIGKTSTMEFAKGLPDPDGPFAIPRNPWHLDHWPGGSSCGSAAAVAAGIVPVALGTDTGGSVRMPAAYCGVTGLKPTFGLIPLDGCLSLAPSMDHVGIVTRTAADAATVLGVLGPWAEAARDGADGTALRIGTSGRLLDEAPGVDVATRAAFLEALDVLRDSGVEVAEVEVPDAAAAMEAVGIVAGFENYAVFGKALERHAALFGPSARERLSAGRDISASDHAAASDVLTRAAEEFEAVFRRVDAFALPTTPGPAETLADLYSKKRDRLVFTRIWSGFGFPAVSVPMRPHPTGLPQGLQVIGRRGHDGDVLRAAGRYQTVTSWHRRRPPVRVPTGGRTEDCAGA